MDKTIDLKQKIEEKYEEEVQSAKERYTRPLAGEPIQVTWYAPLHHHSPPMKTVIFSALFVYGGAASFIFFQGNIIAGIFFALAATFLIINSKRQPPVAEFTVGPLSVRNDFKEYKFSEIKSFWIDYNPGGIKELSLRIKKWYLPYVIMPLADQDPVQIRAILLKFVPEMEHQTSLLEGISRMIGF